MGGARGAVGRLGGFDDLVCCAVCSSVTVSLMPGLCSRSLCRFLRSAPRNQSFCRDGLQERVCAKFGIGTTKAPSGGALLTGRGLWDVEHVVACGGRRRAAGAS